MILRNLTGRDLLRCAQVCKYFFSVVNHTPDLLYIVELCAEGFVDGPPSDISSRERMGLLVRRAGSWRSLVWNKRTTIDMPWARVYHSQRSYVLIIWNWKTGVKLIDMSSSGGYGLYDFCFLTQYRAMLITSTSSTPCLEVWALDPEASTVSTAQTPVFLYLPDLGFDDFIGFSISQCPLYSDIPRDAPFVKRPGGHVYAINIRHSPPRPVSPGLLFVVRHDTIMDLIRRKERPSGGVTIPWEEWGPENTRMFCRHMSREHWNSIYNGWISHDRLLGIFTTSYEEDRVLGPEQILDFNVRPYMRQSATASGVAGKGQLVTAPTTACVRVDDAGQTVTITTSLPFYSTSIDLPGTDQRTGFLLDEHYLIGVKFQGYILHTRESKGCYLSKKLLEDPQHVRLFEADVENEFNLLGPCRP
ncbi:hypothetical protein DENSPDRAFT_875168 [Dentipellis sp. KUC8613]|nr:hypothetical protein DENSPDRAFT_875168 [Dentipellis sp. KUC8613]